MQYSNSSNHLSNRLFKGILIIAGTIFLGFGALGIFLPLLPATPFFLLAAAFYVRGSKRLYSWLINNKWFGSYIKNYKEKKEIPLKIKVLSIFMLWLTIIISIVFFTFATFVRIFLVLIAIVVTLHIVKIKTLDKSKDESY